MQRTGMVAALREARFSIVPAGVGAQSVVRVVGDFGGDVVALSQQNAARAKCFSGSAWSRA
jgi:hypothetical protein